MQQQRETIEVDILFVGGGPASLAAALHLQKLLQEQAQTPGHSRSTPISLAIIEKGAEIGAHTLSGAVVNRMMLEQCLPGLDLSQIPHSTPVTEEDLCYLTSRKHFRFPWIPPSLRHPGDWIISLQRLMQWMGRQAEHSGIEIFSGFAGKELLFDGSRLTGVRTEDKGLDKNGQPKQNYQPGVDLRAKVVVLGEGAHGFLTGQLIKRAGLAEGCNLPIYALGIKETWALPNASSQKGHIGHALGWPLRQAGYGGGFVYHQGELLTVGMVVGLDYPDPQLDPHQEFQRFKTHPAISKLIGEARLAHYGAKLIPEGGYFSIPRCAVDGGLIIGDAAGLVNSQQLKGIHLALQSGRLAAEVIARALRENDFSLKTLSQYDRMLREGPIGQELFRVRNFRQSFQQGLAAGLGQAAVQLITKGRGFRHRLSSRPGNVCLQQAHTGARSLQTPMVFDGTLTFDKLTDLYYSGTRHEEEQPAHIIIQDPNVCRDRCHREYGNPCQHFCPARVFELESAEGGSRDVPRLNPSNCLHCRTCEIMDPYQIIRWMPPEGGGGPNYINL